MNSHTQPFTATRLPRVNDRILKWENDPDTGKLRPYAATVTSTIEWDDTLRNLGPMTVHLVSFCAVDSGPGVVHEKFVAYADPPRDGCWSWPE